MAWSFACCQVRHRTDCKLQVASCGTLSDGRQISCSLFRSTLLLSFEAQMAPDVPKRQHLVTPSDFEQSSSSFTTPFFHQNDPDKCCSLFSEHSAPSGVQEAEAVSKLNSEQLVCRPSDKLLQLETCNLSAEQILSVR